MTNIHLRSTACAICATNGNASELYAANFTSSDLSPAVFSARRLPDGIHYRIVRCNSCGLIRSDPVADSDVSQLYAESSFDYGAELDNLAATYGKYLQRINRYISTKDALLEIGCGNGFALREATRLGYTNVRGVEPSRAAIDSAPGDIREKIICSMMVPGLFPPETFDAVCLFQVLDHILDPVQLLRTCYQILKPGGVLLCLNHNVEAVSARLMKSRSPIIDIEHTYLYSPVTMRRLLVKSGFQVRESRRVWNRYSLRYLSQLIPLPAGLKRRVVRAAEASAIGHISSWVPLGNLYSIAQRPAAGEQSEDLKYPGIKVSDKEATNERYLCTQTQRRSESRSYEQEHGEQSYSSMQMRRWIHQAGGELVYQKFAGFVPMFCSDKLARFMKLWEPVVDCASLLSAMACAVYMLVASACLFATVWKCPGILNTNAHRQFTQTVAALV